MLSGSTLVLLAALWGVVLLPRAVRDARASPVSTVTGFSDVMARLAVCDQRLVVVPAGAGQRIVALPRRRRRDDLIRRRRATLARLLVATGMTVAAAAVLGGVVAWGIAGVAGVTLVAYCVALRAIALRRRPRAEVADAPADRSTTPAVPADPADRVGRRPASPATPRSVDRAAAARGTVTAAGGPRPTPDAPRQPAASGWLEDTFEWPDRVERTPALVADGS